MNRRNSIFSAKLLFLCLIALLLLPSLATAASTITGSVRNQSAGQPAVADEVILLRLADGMQEEARTRTDSQGSFSFSVQFPQGRYLVRVMHQQVNYDREAFVGGTIAVDVFDAATRVEGVSGKIEIIRVGSVGNSLHISDMYDIKNDSAPPLTQAGERSFEFYLPPRAAITSILAAGPGAGGVKVSAAPMKKEPGHYALNFPLRPGETRFAINYDLPYDGHAVLRPRLFYPVQQLAVMFPPTMAFKSESPSFHPIVNEKDFLVQAASPLASGNAPAFEISGNGAPPPISARVRTQTQPQANLDTRPAVSNLEGTAPVTSSASGAVQPRAGGAPGTAAQGRSLLAPAALGLIFVAGAALLVWSRYMQRNAGRKAATVAGAVDGSTGLLEAVKEELFQLEKERVRGSISGEEYATAKQALDVAVQRAMAKAAAQKS